MDVGIYIGRRLSFEGHLCTVRYHGPLAGTTGSWLGVEWDNITRGKHDGKHKGKRIFDCASDSVTAASFIKSGRKSDSERTVLEAIKFKYGTGPAGGASDPEVVVISGKVAEEVGFDKIAREQAELAELRIVLIDQLVVNGIMPRGSPSSCLSGAQNELSVICPNISELDLGWNTIEHWSQILDVCVALPKLTTLKIGGMRFTSLASSLVPSPLAQIRELHLEECLLSAEAIYDVLSDPSGFPSLRELYLSGNALSSLAPATKWITPCVPSLKSLVLENNLFEDLGCLDPIAELFPQVKAVSLQANHISKINLQHGSAEKSFPQIESLNVSHNRIDSYTFVDRLPQMCPNLSSLRIINNPLFLQNDPAITSDPRASDKSFYLTLARVPTLRILNYAKITTRDRLEGEIYYLSVADKELKAMFSTCKEKDRAAMEREMERLYPSYQILAEKYDRPSFIEQLLNTTDGTDTVNDVTGVLKQMYPPGSLGARLITVTFHMTIADGTGKHGDKITMRLPSSLPATRLMSIVLHHPAFTAQLKPLQFNLIYESSELDPVDTTAESTTRSAVYGKRLTLEQKKSLWREFGDWDADAMVDEALQQQAAQAKDGVSDRAGSHVTNEHWTKDGKYLVREGRKWRRREIVIPHALKRPWGDWIEEAKEVTIRIEPFERQKWGT